MNFDEPDPFQQAPRTENHNSASDYAHVGQQININEQHGRTVFHQESLTYYIGPGDPPERRHQVALTHLASDTPRIAEKIFDKLLLEDCISPERAYYYVLSVLSGRSWHDLRGDVVGNIKNIRKISKSSDQDHWSEALDVVWRLLDQMRHDLDNPADLERSDEAFGMLDRLPPERQEEIRLHLETVFDGVSGDRLEAGSTHRIVLQRLGGRRRERAWLFFEPVPARPKPDQVQQVTPARSDWAHALWGGAGVALSIAVLPVGSVGPGSVLGAFALAGAGYLLLRQGIAGQTQRLQAAARRREAEPPDTPVVARSPGHWVRTDFVQEIHRLVDARFSEARPHVAGNWPAYTEVVRAHLKQRLVDRYGNAQVEAAALDWLIRWHAERAAAGWNRCAPEEDRTTSAESTRSDVLFYLGALVAAVGLTLLVLAGQWVAAPLLGVGGTFAVRGVIRIRSVAGLNAFLRARAQSRHGEEIKAYEEWLITLADRPSDPEMARWLAMDKIYLRTDAARRAGLIAHDLVAHVVAVEGTKDSRRAKEWKRPFRYSAYQVQIFLLTRSGVREARVELDFLTGEVRNERRNLFRYDALESAKVTERGYRTTKGVGPFPVEVERLRGRTLRLTLSSGQTIAVIGENFRRNLDPLVEDDEEDQDLATLQTSGVEGALPILEAVAAEGSDWIAREHERRRRWVQDWDG